MRFSGGCIQTKELTLDTLFSCQIRISSVGFCGGRRTCEASEKPSDQERETTKNSHIGLHIWESNPGLIGWRGEL